MKRGRTRIDDSVYPLFITTTIIDFIPVFGDEETAHAVLRLLDERRSQHDIRVYAYALMPHHFHAIVHPVRRGETSRFVGAWKSLSARIVLQKAKPAVHERFAAAARQYAEPSRKQHKVWMSRFDDLALYDQNTLATKFNYIHRNPVKAGLVERPEDYPYSSARFYESDADSGVVKLTDCRHLLSGRSP